MGVQGSESHAGVRCGVPLGHHGQSGVYPIEKWRLRLIGCEEKVCREEDMHVRN